MSTNPRKRRASSDAVAEECSEKRVKLVAPKSADSDAHPTLNRHQSASSSKSQISATSESGSRMNQDRNKEPQKSAGKRVNINKLAAPRPFPTVAASASATGPRSAHKEGKNYICLTRKTSLGAYMRRCKNLIINDGYKTLHLHAAGAAIPLLLQLACALPPILPFSKDEIHTDISTGTVEVQDEIIPEDENEDLSYRTRGKSTLYVIFRIGDGQSENDALNAPTASKTKPFQSRPKPKSKKSTGDREILVYEEPEQEQEGI